MRLGLIMMAAAAVCSACDTSGAVFGRPEPTVPTEPLPMPTPGAGQCVQTDSKAYTEFRWAPLREPFEYNFPVACSGTELALSSPLSVIGPDNQPLQGSVTISTIPDGGPGELLGTVRFVPRLAGLHTLTWTDFPRPDLWVEGTEPVAVRRLVREFSDRMDLCTNGIFLTPSGFTVCSLESLGIRLYDPRGELVETVSAWPKDVAVVGDTLWSSSGGGAMVTIEARRFSDAGVRLVGTSQLIPAGEAQGPITETSFERGFVRLTMADGGFERSTLRPPFRTDSPIALMEGSNVFTALGCRARPGCSATPLECPPVTTCFIQRPGLHHLGMTSDTLWLYQWTGGITGGLAGRTTGRVVMVPRPIGESNFVVSDEPHGERRAGPPFERSAMRILSELPHLKPWPGEDFGEWERQAVVIPLRRGNVTRYASVRSQGRVIAVTPFAVSALLADPFAVEFLLLPPSM
jgi:hypothetical protein